AELSQERNGGTHEKNIRKITRELKRLKNQPEDFLLCVAELSGQIVGYARAVSYDPEAEHSARLPRSPGGWYLTGVVVNPDFRRRGIGHALTLFRMEWIRQRSDRVYYFVHPRNQASIDLHTRIGFQEIGRG